MTVFTDVPWANIPDGKSSARAYATLIYIWERQNSEEFLRLRPFI